MHTDFLLLFSLLVGIGRYFSCACIRFFVLVIRVLPKYLFHHDPEVVSFEELPKINLFRLTINKKYRN